MGPAVTTDGERGTDSCPHSSTAGRVWLQGIRTLDTIPSLNRTAPTGDVIHVVLEGFEQMAIVIRRDASGKAVQASAPVPGLIPTVDLLQIDFFGGSNRNSRTLDGLHELLPGFPCHGFETAHVLAEKALQRPSLPAQCRLRDPRRLQPRAGDRTGFPPRSVDDESLPRQHVTGFREHIGITRCRQVSRAPLSASADCVSALSAFSG